MSKDEAEKIVETALQPPKDDEEFIAFAREALPKLAGFAQATLKTAEVWENVVVYEFGYDREEVTWASAQEARAEYDAEEIYNLRDEFLK